MLSACAVLSSTHSVLRSIQRLLPCIPLLCIYVLMCDLNGLGKMKNSCRVARWHRSDIDIHGVLLLLRQELAKERET